MPQENLNASAQLGRVFSGRKLTTSTITHMAKYKLEYIWLDGYEPVPNLRGKTQIQEFKSLPQAGRTPDVGL